LLRKTVSGIILSLLVISTLTLAFNIKPVKAEGGTIYIRADGSIDPPTAPILQDGNIYTLTNNAVVDGADRTTESAGAQKSAEIFIGKSKILRHKVTSFEIERLKGHVGTSEENENYNKIINGYGTGLAPPTRDEWKKIANNTYVVDQVLLNNVSTYQSSVDHTTKPWFPPIGDQDGEGSCTCWAVGYYIKTFQEAKEHGWDLSGAIWDGGQPSNDYQDRIMSPDFIYHLINYGVDGGSSPWTAINLICSVGASSWETMPYNPSDHTTWPSEEAWREAPLYRGNSSGYEWMWIDTNEGLASLKDWLALDNLAAITVDATKIYNGLWSLLTSKDMLTLDNYGPPISLNHEVTVVGYDDNFEYTEQSQTRHGAFKIANSWGIGGFMGWENVPDGCFWISYEVMKQWIGWCEFYFDRLGYNPELVASFRITHSKRGECDITVGVESQTKMFNEFIHGGDQPFCSNDIFLDITEFKDAIPNVVGQQFFLKVYDGGTSTTGTINKFAIEYVKSTDPPISTVNGGNVYAYVTLSPLETSWGSGKQVCSDNDFIDSKVSMATDSNGYLYVAYDDWYPAINQYAVFVRRSTDDGRTWSTIYIAYDSTHNVRYPSIAIDPYTNDIFVAVEREWTPNDHDIFVMRRVCGVWSWSPVANVLGSDDRFPSITSEYQYGPGNWQYISYEYVHTYNDRDLMFAKSTDHGATWTVKKLHGDFPDYNVYAQTSITNAEGYIYIAYKWGADYNSPCEIRVDHSTDFGDTWTQFTDIDGLPNNCAFPTIAATHGGSTVIVAFQYDWSTRDVDVWYSYSTDKGTTWVKGNPLFTSGLENEKFPVLAVDGGGSTENDVRGCFHVVSKVGSFINYKKANYSTPYSWSPPVIASERWIGKGLAIATQYRNRTAEFHPCVAWTDERTNNIYFSTVGYVHNLNTGLRYDSIQEAINANETLNGHTLLAESRTYNEMVFVNKSVTLLGENWADTIICGKGFNYVVEVTANNSVLNGYTIKNGYVGIGIDRCSNVTVRNTLVTENEIGIVLDGSLSNKILENNITLNSWYGMLILRSTDNFLRNNSMHANKCNFGIQGENLSSFVHDIDISNTVNGKPVYYWINEKEKSVPFDAGYVALINCTHITVQNLDLTNNGEGILLAYTTYSWMRGNRITYNDCGICFYNSSNNILYESIISNRYYGIYLYSSSNNAIYHNFMDNPEQVYSYVSINIWDNGYPFGGNYWSDYEGVDLCRGPYQNETGIDGIGDTPYIIDAENQDCYPLMYPWGLEPVHNIATGLCYASIQEAINANETLNGHTIYVEAGEYNENVVVNKSISLIGESKETTIIDGNSDNVFSITADNVVVKGFTIRNGNRGVYIDQCSHVVILDNIVTNNFDGIFLSGSFNGVISENNVTYNRRFGIWVIWSSNNTLRNNNMLGNTYNFGVWGSELSNFIHDIDYSNTVNNKPIYYLINGGDLLIDPSTSPDVGFLGIINSTNVVIQNLYFKNNIQGILFAYTNYSAIVNCTIMDNYDGIDFCSSSHNIVSGNVVIKNGIGIEMWYPSINNTVSANTIVANEACGIDLLQASYSEIKANNITGSYFGIFLHTSSFNKLYRNEIENHSYGISIWNASNNSIFNNNFINNTHHVDSRYSVNVWDNGYPSSGNYWSDYTDVDVYRGPYQNETGSDGIGDTLYIIDANNTDHYPLMRPWSPPDIAATNITTYIKIGSIIIQRNIFPPPPISCRIYVNVTVQNQGNKIEAFNITVYANDNFVDNKTNVFLFSGNSTTLNFEWNTTGFDKGNYTIWAYVSPISGEVNVADNTLTDGWIIITIPGDINGDFKVDIKDLVLVIKYFGSYPGHPTKPWNPNADINCDNKVDIKDLVLVIKHFGEHYP